MEEIFIGKIVNVFGIKGELKIVSSFDMPDKAFKKNNIIIINKEEHLITSVRFHKNNYLVEIDNLKDINLVLKYKGYNVFIKKDYLNLKQEEYLIEELYNLDVYDNSEFIGKVTEVINNKINPLIKVNDSFYIPLKGNFIDTVDIKSQKIICQNIGGLML